MSCAYKFNAAGRLVTVLSGAAVAPLAVTGALTFDANGALVIVASGAVPDAVANNWPFSPTGELKVNITDTPLVGGSIQASLTRAIGASQQIWCSQNNAIASWSEGLPFDAGGNLCIGADVVNDPFFASVVALLHFAGTNGSTNVVNSCPRGSTWTCNAGTSLTTTNPEYGTACLNAGAGNGGCVSTSPDYVVGTGDFTCEFSFWWPAKMDSYCFDLGNAASAGEFTMDPGAAFAYTEVAGGGGWSHGASNFDLTVNTWHKVAWSRVAGFMYWMLDGVLKDSGAFAQNVSGSQLSFGRSIARGFPTIARFSEFRLTKGVGRYTGNYAVATAPFPDS